MLRLKVPNTPVTQPQDGDCIVYNPPSKLLRIERGVDTILFDDYHERDDDKWLLNCIDNQSDFLCICQLITVMTPNLKVVECAETDTGEWFCKLTAVPET